MLDQLKMMSQTMSAMAGDGNRVALRKSLIALDEDAPAYEDMDEKEQSQVNEAVDAMMEMGKLFDKALKARAKMSYKFYSALMAEGFNETQALQILIAQGAEIMKPGE